MSIFQPFPRMETKNLCLRRMKLEDKYDLYKIRRDPRIHEHTDSKPDENMEETETYIHRMIKGVEGNEFILWAIEHQESKRLIGSICIFNIDRKNDSGELGYILETTYQGKGFMGEALLKVVHYGFKILKLKALYAYTEIHNTPSKKLLENSHFLRVGKEEDQGVIKDRTFHMIVYRLENTMQSSSQRRDDGYEGITL